jgi:hypothetical protein
MRTPAVDDRVRRLVEATDEAAAADLFVSLCRASPALRDWLWEDFARNPEVRRAFAARLRRRHGMVRRFADLSDEARPWQEEVRRLQATFPRRLYGGLTWPELEKLIATYRAGRGDLGAFLLAHELGSAGQSTIASPRLTRAAVDFISAACADPRLLRQLERAFELARNHANRASRRAALGYSDWWKLHVLFFVLRHPRPAYRIRDLRTHLAALGLNPTVKDLQRFCARHGLKRDMRAGRPRAPTVASESGSQRNSRRSRATLRGRR